MKIFKLKNLHSNEDNYIKNYEEEEQKSKGASRKAASRYDQCSIENDELLSPL